MKQTNENFYKVWDIYVYKCALNDLFFEKK